MFDVKAVVREIQSAGNPDFNSATRAKVAKRANNSKNVSTFSTFSTLPSHKNISIVNLGSPNIVHGKSDMDSDNDEARTLQSTDDPIPFTDHEIAEQKIDGLKLHDDRVFVRQKLIGFYGSKRLDIVEKYFEQWQLGVESESVQIKQDNAGRHRANAWLRNTYKRS